MSTDSSGNFSLEEGKYHTTWFVVRSVVYNVENFIEHHPGGQSLLREHAGSDVTELMEGSSGHVHSEASYAILRKYKIGFIGNSLYEEMREEMCEQFLDIAKPLIAQFATMSITKAQYLEAVHKPQHVAGSVRLFANPFFEVLTRTPWIAVPAVWIPISAAFIYTSITSHRLAIPQTALAFVVGLCLWTLIEYLLHRYLFHVERWMPNSRWFFMAHFLMHGVHHHFPMDRLRLVMPPIVVAILAYPIITVVTVFMPRAHAYAISAGGLIGYVAYDITHYLLHHSSLSFSFLQKVKVRHLDHHFRHPNLAFGVTTGFWDRVFHTAQN